MYRPLECVVPLFSKDGRNPYGINTFMLIHELDLFEAFAKPQEMKNKRVVDYRKPNIVPKRWDGKKQSIHITFKKDNTAAISYYGDANIIPWQELMDQLRNNMTDFQPGIHGIVVYRNGYIINSTRGDGPVWTGKVNKYSDDVKEIAQSLLAIGLATEQTPIWTGNWARGKPDAYLSNVGKLLSAPELPKRIIFLHGTSSYRWNLIQKNGLNPVDINARIWKKGWVKTAPAHRDESVYLTVDMKQAEYYAEKAVNVDKFGYLKYQRKIFQTWWDANNKLQWSSSPENKHQHITDEQKNKLQEIIDATTPIAQWYKSDEKLRGVIVKISIPASQYGLLRADDDHINAKSDVDPMDWEGSLREYSQVAYAGSISPDRIKFFKYVE